jgi:hypothetical protein
MPLARYARMTPRAPPATASSMLSVSNWRISLDRPAPSDSRTAISLRRDVARANNRLATLAQEIKSTRPTTTIRTESGLENS